MVKKYEITWEVKTLPNGIVVRRIRSLHELSQDITTDISWADANAMVYSKVRKE